VRLSSEFRASLEAMATSYQSALSEAGRDYLSARGLGPEAVDFYRLGQVDSSHAEHARYNGWLCIPYLTRAGVVSLKFRQTVPEATPKYLTPYPTRLYNTLAMDEADRLGYIGITEGEFDAEINSFYCGIPSVGIPGVETYKKHPEWRELLRGYSKVLIFPDPDEPGRELASQLIRDIDTATIVRLPGHDVNKTYQLHGADAIREMAGL
jgi:DNA primase